MSGPSVFRVALMLAALCGAMPAAAQAPTPLPRPDRPQIQPPRPRPPEPPRPPRPQPPRPQPPRPPEPPRPPRPPVPPPVVRGTAILYSGPGWSGRYLTVRQNIPDLRRYGFEDRAVSLRTIGRWEICSERNYRGRCITVMGDQRLFGTGVRGRVSSIRYRGR